jgi:deazaflavin-dependent oxidoreductase (nitroreductase family)
MTVWGSLDRELESVLDGDLTVILAQVTPLRGVVLTPVNNFGWDGSTGTLIFTSDLAAFKKLRRIERSPKVTVVFHAREHGRASGDAYLLLQGDASFSWKPDRDELARLLDRPGMTLGPAGLGGRAWGWWLAPFFWERVTIRVRAWRLLAFPDRRCLGAPRVVGADVPHAPPAPQRPPAKGTGPRIAVARAARRLQRLPHRLLGWVGDDGYPIVVPVSVAATSDDGFALTAPNGIIPRGERRAGLTGHWFSAGTLGQRQSVMTGWLTSDGTRRHVYAPHTSLSYTLPPSRLLFRIVVGGLIRIGLWRARRAGVPLRRTFADRWRSIATAFQRRVANPVARRLAPLLPGAAVLETIGRRSGQPRRTPVGGRLRADTFWCVSEFGHKSQYVRNIVVNPRVRVQIGGQWRRGTASILEHDDAQARLKDLPWLNSVLVRLVGTNLLTIRVALD